MRKEKIYNAAKDLPNDAFYLILTNHKEMRNKEKIIKNESLYIFMWSLFLSSVEKPAIFNFNQYSTSSDGDSKLVKMDQETLNIKKIRWN